MAVPGSECDSYFPFLWSVWAFDFAICLETFNLEIYLEFGILVILLFIYVNIHYCQAVHQIWSPCVNVNWQIFQVYSGWELINVKHYIYVLTRMKSWKFGLPFTNVGLIDLRGRNFTFQQSKKELLKESHFQLEMVVNL